MKRTIISTLYLATLSLSLPQLGSRAIARSGANLDVSFNPLLARDNGNREVSPKRLEKRYTTTQTTVNGRKTFTRTRTMPDATTVVRNGRTIIRTYYVPSSSDGASSSSAAPSSSSSAPNSSPSGAPGSLEYLALKTHNDFRALHGANPLVWSDTLAAAAQTWANKCVWQHSMGAVGPYGENLAATAGYASTIADGINMWSAEAKDYDPSNPQYSHFTQEVWKSTTTLGCAQATCPAGGLFDASYGPWTFYVCEYDPPGNILGKANFDANVQL
ncbi:PR-1-like protein [Meredithblackwellia eburnea MCA 4105]